jgi:hypothetical protein
LLAAIELKKSGFDKKDLGDWGGISGKDKAGTWSVP